MLDPGQRDTVVRVLRRPAPTTGQAAAGEHVEVFWRWGRIRPLSGNEAREAGAASDAAELEVIVLACSQTRTISNADAVLVKGRRYGVVTVQPEIEGEILFRADSRRSR
jgi:head-tail adaptor